MWMIVFASVAGLAAPTGNQHAAGQALSDLVEGNRRFVQGRSQHPRQSPARRQGVANEQHPRAVILSCADSRVPPEILFDQGIGDLFVIRAAGNVLQDVVLGSIEYAVEHLQTPLVLVLGHERCGAVGAAVKGGEAHGHIKAIVLAIQPAVEKARGRDGEPIENAVRAHVQEVVAELKASEPILAEHVRRNTLVVDGARYDLDSGVVDLAPWSK